jgi:guanylate kinase
LKTCYSKIYNLIQAETKNGSKDYDPNYIRSHIEKLTS